MRPGTCTPAGACLGLLPPALPPRASCGGAVIPGARWKTTPSSPERPAVQRARDWAPAPCLEGGSARHSGRAASPVGTTLAVPAPTCRHRHASRATRDPACTHRLLDAAARAVPPVPGAMAAGEPALPDHPDRAACEGELRAVSSLPRKLDMYFQSVARTFLKSLPEGEDRAIQVLSVGSVTPYDDEGLAAALAEADRRITFVRMRWQCIRSHAAAHAGLRPTSPDTSSPPTVPTSATRVTPSASSPPTTPTHLLSSTRSPTSQRRQSPPPPPSSSSTAALPPSPTPPPRSGGRSRSLATVGT